MTDPQKEFDDMDGNDGGIVLFDEFAGWALKRGLDLDGGEDDDTLVKHHRTSDQELAIVPKKKKQEKQLTEEEMLQEAIKLSLQVEDNTKQKQKEQEEEEDSVNTEDLYDEQDTVFEPKAKEEQKEEEI